MNPLEAYEAAVEELRREPTEKNDVEAARRHRDCLAWVWLSPWWAKRRRERALSRLVRRHAEIGPLVRRRGLAVVAHSNPA